MTHEEFAETIF
jgi:hypothetical protein